MDAGRTHKTSGSETKDFFAHRKGSSKSNGIFLCWFPEPQFSQARWHLYRQWETSQERRNLKLREPDLKQWAVSAPDCTLSWEGHYLKKTVWSKGQSGSAHEACRNVTGPWRMVLQQVFSTYGKWAHNPVATPEGKGWRRWGAGSTGQLIMSFLCWFFLVSVMKRALGDLSVDFGMHLTFWCMQSSIHCLDRG